jgi:hypothetical protein
MRKRSLIFAALLLVTSWSASAATCESIRAEIEAKIRASGVARFTLATVATDAKVTGKVVGSCDLGTRKIVYLPAELATPPAAARSSDDAILTECKDGTVSVGGDCKKQRPNE